MPPAAVIRPAARLPRLRAATALAAALAGCSAQPDVPLIHSAPPAPAAARALPAFAAPPTRREEIADDYHGETIADPYRWLEDQDGAEVAAWVREQNAATRAFLDAVPERTAIRARLAELWNHPRHSAPIRAGARWFSTRNDGLQNQSVWLVGQSPGDPGEILFDPNALSPDGTVALASFQPNEDGSLVAYALSAKGSDWREWRVLDVATKRPLDDHLRWAKFSGAAWTKDGKGFFYQRYPEPAAGAEFEAQNRNPQLCYHRIGTAQDADVVVYERRDQPEWAFGARVTESGRFLIVRIASGTDRRNRVAYVDLEQDGWPVQPLLMDADASYDFVDHDGDAFWFTTDKDAPRGRVVAIDRTAPDAAQWRTLIGEQPHALQGARVLGGHFVCTWLADAASRISVHALDGAHLRDLELPALGSAGGFSGKRTDPVAYFSFNSFVHAPAVLQHDLRTGATTVFRPSALAYDASGIVTERAFLHSADGTRLCLFLVHRRDLALDGTHPTYLYGYGGFDASMVPAFSVPNLVFVERGGVYAQAVLRGGGEYGEDWHRAGMRERKQNVFDDFAACARYLARNGYTSRERLAIGGGSNGGLLVGAMLTQAPDLFGAAIPEVGVLDMLRYHRFTIGWAWAPEYGTSDDPEQFRWLRAYSPLHNVRDGAAYPPTMVMTGDHDDRVLPGHSYKFAAALQAAQAAAAPILLRVETSAGHGAGKPIGKLIDEAADRWAFLAALFGV